MSYCKAIELMNGAEKAYHKAYHDNLYGFPIDDDNELFARFVFEINQAGLNWLTILKKEQNFRKAYHGFDIATVASYLDQDRRRLLSDAGIIRNKLKINAVIENARTIILLQKTHGTFKLWLENNHPLDKQDWVKLFKKTFKFTGHEITGEFLMSIGILPNAHEESCPIYPNILKAQPLWLQAA